MAKKITLEQWIINFDAGRYQSDNIGTQIEARGYDGFCNDTSLASRLKRLAPKVKQIAKSSKIDPTKTYVWFKNNWPIVGKLYDDFRIADMETGAPLYWVVPKTGHKGADGPAEVWGVENNWEGPIVKSTWKDVTNYFGV